jgi:hypothetical protein
MPTSIPAFHVSEASKVEGSGDIFIASRKDAASSGVFGVRLSVHFDPLGGDDYPTGSLLIKVDLSDSFKGSYRATSIELVNSYGKHNPTVYLTGRCSIEAAPGAGEARGLRYWLLIANNKAVTDKEGTPDIVGFAIHDHTGSRIAYGTGPLKSGDFNVASK